MFKSIRRTENEEEFKTKTQAEIRQNNKKKRKQKVSFIKNETKEEKQIRVKALLETEGCAFLN